MISQTIGTATNYADAEKDDLVFKFETVTVLNRFVNNIDGYQGSLSEKNTIA
jgi:hypothetical protein